MSDVPYVNLDPYLAGVQALLFALQEAGLIPDLNPLDYIISAFDGKPKLEDTELAALRLQTSPWWPLKALGTNLQIWVKNGVPLSTGIAAYRAQLSEWIRGTIDSIEPIVFGRLDPYSLDHAIWLSMTSQDGDRAIVELNNTIAAQHALGPLPSLPDTTPQPPPGVVPGTGPNDILVTTGGDELNDLQRTIIFQNSLIYDALLNLGKALNNPGDDKCCANVVASISNVVGQLSIIAAELSATNSTTVNIDFTPLTSELANLVTAIGAYPPALQACCAAINGNLANIADAIGKTAGTDVSGIIEQLKALVREGDVKQVILDSLLTEGYLTGADAQVLHGADWADSLIRIGRTALWSGWNWFLSLCGVDVSSGRPVVKPLGSTIADDIARAINFALGAGAAPLYPEVKGIIDGVAAQLVPAGLPSIGDVKVDPDLLLAKTLSPLLIVNAVALIVDYFGWEISETLKQYTEWISEFVGLQEVRELKVGQMMRFGPMREAELRAKATYRQEIAGMGTMSTWAARGLYDQGRVRGLAPALGIPIEQVQPAMEAAYGGISAFILIRLLETGIYSQADIADELTFSGMRPASQKRLLAGANYLATQSYRTKLEANLEAAHAAGLISDQELTDGIDSAEQNYNRDSLILTASNYKKLVAIAKDLEAEYTTLYLARLIDDATFRSYLAGIGIQPDMVNALAGKAEARANATLHRKEIAAAAALQRATATVERQAALKNFEQGNLTLPLYIAALIATGLTPTQAAAWGDLAQLKKQGNVRWLYGLQLAPAAAIELRQRVAALTDQRKRQFITQAQYTQALAQLGINNTWINALDAAAEAMLTPKLDAFAVPVQTS